MLSAQAAFAAVAAFAATEDMLSRISERNAFAFSSVCAPSSPAFCAAIIASFTAFTVADTAFIEPRAAEPAAAYPRSVRRAAAFSAYSAALFA